MPGLQSLPVTCPGGRCESGAQSLRSRLSGSRDLGPQSRRGAALRAEWPTVTAQAGARWPDAQPGPSWKQTPPGTPSSASRSTLPSGGEDRTSGPRVTAREPARGRAQKSSVWGTCLFLSLLSSAFSAHRGSEIRYSRRPGCVTRPHCNSGFKSLPEARSQPPLGPPLFSRPWNRNRLGLVCRSLARCYWP